jgi:hypothetical protein
MDMSAPVKKSIIPAGLMSSGPIGGDAVKNSIGASESFAILTLFYLLVSANRCSFPGSWREVSEALAMRASLGLTYRDHLADPVANHHGVNIATKAEDGFLLLS